MKKLTTEIYDLAFGGDGVGKIDGKVCFVRDALPGEEVIFNVIKETSSFIKGEIADIKTASPERVDPVCKYYYQCGGCQLQHIGYEAEMKYKKKQFEELFARVGSFKGFKLDEAISSKDHYNYRSHITLHKTGDKYGFYTRDERSIMEIASCSIAEEAINGALPAAAKADDKDRLTIKADHAGRLWSSNKMGERFFPDTYAGKEMMFSPLAFSQANRHISVEMARVLGEWIGPERADTVFFDIFSGIGFFSFLLAPGFAKTIGADNDRVAISAAKTTAKEKGYEGMKFYILDAENEMERLYNSEKGKKNIALIDPPRKGLPAEFVEWLSFAEGLDEIYYISCDPARMARDIKAMTGGTNWRIGKSAMFDMFPRTKHIEAMVKLARQVNN